MERKEDEMGGAVKFPSEGLKQRVNSEELQINRKIVLKLILKN
jgi:hypothetical protein